MRILRLLKGLEVIRRAITYTPCRRRRLWGGGRGVWAGWGNGKGGKGVVGIVVRGEVVLWARGEG